MAHAQVFNSGNEILMDFANSLVRPGIVDNTVAVANSEGHKIIKAGTPVGAAKPFKDDPNNVTLSPVADDTAQGVVMHDIDVTAGATSGAIILRGDVIKANMDADVQALWNDTIEKALTHVILL